MNGDQVPHQLAHEAVVPVAVPADPDVMQPRGHLQPPTNPQQRNDIMTNTRACILPVVTDAIDRKQPFTIYPAMHQPNISEDGKPIRATFSSAVANRLYISREAGRDLFGPLDFTGKDGDQLDVERRGPIGCDAPAIERLELWKRADQMAAVDRPDLAAAFHAVGWLPAELGETEWRNLVHRFVDDQLVRNGMVTDFAIHRLRGADGEWAKMPHVHLIITSRGWRPQGNAGRRNLAWFGSPRSVTAAAEAWRQLVLETTPGRATLPCAPPPRR